MWRWRGGVERQRAQRCEVPVILEHWSLLLQCSRCQGQSLSIVSGPSRAVAVSMT